MTNRTGIYLLDDNELVLESMKKLIDREPDMRVVGSASAGRAAIAEIAVLRPDIAVIDLGLGDIDGLDVIRTLKTMASGVRFLVLSMRDEHVFGPQSMRAGAHGYLMKQHSIENVLPALRSIAKGVPFLSRDLRAQISDDNATKFQKDTAGGDQ